MRSHGPSPRRRRGPLALLASAFLASGAWLMASVLPVAACSCAMFESMKDYATPDNAVFTGIAGLREPRGVPVQVDMWLWGEGAAPIVWLADGSFGDGASCGTTPPPPESAWIWVTWRNPDANDFQTGLCSPAAMLDTDEGKAMLEEAMALLNGLPSTPTSGPTEGAPGPTDPLDPSAGARDMTGLAVGAGVVAASIGLFGGLAFAARRQRRGS